MTANLQIIVAQREDVLTIPNAGLRFRLPGSAANAARGKPGSDRTVYVMRDDGSGPSEPVRIKTGISDGSFTEVTEGLKEGENAPAQPDDMADVGRTMTALLDFLSPEKQSQALELIRQSQVRALKANTASLGAAAERKNQLAELDVELARILTPEEKFEVDLRMSKS